MNNPPGNQFPNNDAVMASRERTAGRRYFWVGGTPIFSPDQIAELKSIVDNDSAPALLEGGGENIERPETRRTRVHWLNLQEYPWVYELIWTQANQANALFQFDVLPMQDTIQLAVYDSSEQGHFEWHTDIVASDLTRKISITVPLNNGDEFEGGELEFHVGAIQRAPQIAGAPVMFPSWLLHRVTPVTSGKRYSLVAWIRGPGWR